MASAAVPALRHLPPCRACGKEITSVRIECAACAGVLLCIDCFASGTAIPDVGHVGGHPYKVHDNLAAVALYERDWSADEELMLLQGIEMYGMGNWRDVANYVGSKDEAACGRHYTAVYLASPVFPLPQGDPSLAAATTAAQAAVREPGDAAAEGGGGRGGGRGGGGRGGAAAAAAASSSAGGDAGRSGTGGSHTGTPGYSHDHIPRTDVAGFMPLRGDFDVEHDNDAEGPLADMEFEEGEHATETELKLKILEIYNARLDERERRKAFVIERGLLEYKRLLAAERRRPKEERDVYDALRPFARFMTPSEHEDLVRGLVLEARLRSAIGSLQAHRAAGVTTLAQAREAENAAARRRRADGGLGVGAAASAPAYLSPAMLASSGGGGGSGGYGATAAAPRRAASDMVGGAGEIGAAVLEDSAASAPAVVGGGGGVAGDGGEAGEEGEEGGGAPGRKRRRGAGRADGGEGAAAGAGGEAAGAPPSAAAGVPGWERLAPEERGLCAHLRMLPAQYEEVKATILALAAGRGVLKRSEAAGAFASSAVDAGKINGVYDFAVAAGWAVGAEG